MPNTTQTAAWENYVSHRGCWICTNLWSVFLTCLSEPCWCLQQRKIFGIGHFSPNFTPCRKQKMVFSCKNVFVLNCNHEDLHFFPFLWSPMSVHLLLVLHFFLAFRELWAFSPLHLASAILHIKIPYRSWGLGWVRSVQVYLAPCAGFPIYFFLNPHSLVQVKMFF